MARCSSITAYGIIVSASLLLLACKKQVAEPGEQSKEVAASVESKDNCRATVLGRSTVHGTPVWHTLMQRWYNGDGKVAFLKAKIGWPTGLPNDNFHINLDWGQLTYEGNQVYLKDPQNSVSMRVTLDDEGRAVASYFESFSTTQVPYIDTSYYHYTGKRLDSILGFMKWKNSFNPTESFFFKIRYSYDQYGNVIYIEQGSSRMHLKYDYSKPIKQMFAPHHLTFHHKLLEYMDLLHFPIHHQLVHAWRGEYHITHYNQPYGIYPTAVWEYSNYWMQDPGVVYSYTTHSNNLRYFTGWECNTTPAGNEATSRQNTSINSLEDFKRRFPVTK
jgi:hypothetical protein